jgi:hypothetical protein
MYVYVTTVFCSGSSNLKSATKCSENCNSSFRFKLRDDEEMPILCVRGKQEEAHGPSEKSRRPRTSTSMKSSLGRHRINLSEAILDWQAQFSSGRLYGTRQTDSVLHIEPGWLTNNATRIHTIKLSAKVLSLTMAGTAGIVVFSGLFLSEPK